MALLASPSSEASTVEIGAPGMTEQKFPKLQFVKKLTPHLLSFQ